MRGNTYVTHNGKNAVWWIQPPLPPCPPPAQTVVNVTHTAVVYITHGTKTLAHFLVSPIHASSERNLGRIFSSDAFWEGRLEKRTWGRGIWQATTHLEAAGAYNHILASSIGQEGRNWATVKGAKLHHMDVVVTGHCVAGSSTRVLHAKCIFGDVHVWCIYSLVWLYHLHQDWRGVNI